MEPKDLFDEEKFRPTAEDQLPPADFTELMEQAYQNRAYFPEFCRRLMVEPLLVLVNEVPEGWEPGSPERVGITLRHLQSGELPVFTSNDAIFAQSGLDPATTRSLFVVGRELLSSVGDQTVILNPFNEINLALSSTFIGQLLSGELKPTGMEGGEIELDEEAEDYVERIPEAYDDTAGELTHQLRLLLGQHPRARKAYLIWQRNMSDDQESCFLLLLVMDGDPQRITQEIGFVARDFLSPVRRNLKILVNADPEAFEPYGDALQIAPFYEG